ncbi:excinuclease ABC subunit C [Bdellovibrio bacteriovorus]|uniref:UvrABC system protein C n=1 Tax=Bdellovibrio bacteriovorus TaxID=959 RepID=A0A150WD94_BDEBC|nr:excinuclease ABC subunit UvrC [Bdellovibrio bacteriovorus]KYG60860.1 excinuclease ABC subunit C [Bdellovibrio bacteriovorus]
MISKFEEVRDKVREFPVQSGVYLMKGHADKIIYIGKAKNLRARVRSYFTDSKDHSPKTRLLVQNIHEVEYILTKTEVEAFLLEASLIKKHRPKYNIRLRDDKAYPYIRFTWADDYPRLYVARKVKKDGSLYFGPYTSGFAVQGTIRFLNRTFKIRDCTDAVFKSRTRPCMTYQIGRCTAPCVEYINQTDYREEVEGAKLFLKGQNKKVVKSITERMMVAAEEEKFEVAARLRDSVQAIKAILEKQAVINDTSEKDQDAVGFFGDHRGCLVETVHVRSGRVIGTRSHFLPHFDPNDPAEDPREWLVDFLNQYYEDNFIPDEVLLTVDIGNDLTKLMGEVLKERSGNKVVVRFATDERGRNLIDMANENAKSHFLKYVSKSEEKLRGLDEIKEKLSLPELPRRIECYDISTFQGAETVASQVVFEDGVPAKEHYRRYKIRTVQGINDFASMYEVLSRRFKHTEYEDPQLIVIDGGKGQLTQAIRILQEIGRSDIPVVGLAKARTESDFQKQEVESTEERFFLPNRSNPVIFKHNAEALHILTGIRDEAHRFAITYHRKLRESSSLESELDYVVGLGEKRKKVLLTRFNSIDEIKGAVPEEIATLKGFNRVLAERILLQLNEPDDEDAEVEE